VVSVYAGDGVAVGARVVGTGSERAREREREREREINDGVEL